MDCLPSQSAHESLRFLVPILNGRVSVTVQIVVGGQHSNVFVVPVQPPVIENLNIFDVTVLVEPSCVLLLRWFLTIHCVSRVLIAVAC